LRTIGRILGVRAIVLMIVWVVGGPWLRVGALLALAVVIGLDSEIDGAGGAVVYRSLVERRRASMPVDRVDAGAGKGTTTYSS
jgi:hypothetical protein